MSDYKYTYTSPVDRGYIRIKLSPVEHKEIFGRYNKCERYECYENQNEFIRECYTSVWIKILNIVLYPALILIHGLGSIKEINTDIKGLFHEKDKGHFAQDWRLKENLLKCHKNFIDHYK